MLVMIITKKKLIQNSLIKGPSGYLSLELKQLIRFFRRCIQPKPGAMEFTNFNNRCSEN